MNHRSVSSYLAFFVTSPIIPCLLFTLDSSCFLLLHSSFIHTLATFTLVIVLYDEHLCPSFFFCYLFLALLSFITTGLVTPYVIFLSLFFVVAKYVSLYCTYIPFIAYGTSVLFTLIPVFISAKTLPFCWPAYTALGIAANLTTVYFSLKWSPAVKRGNRS